MVKRNFHYIIILFIELFLFLSLIAFVSCFFNITLLMLFKEHLPFLYTILFIFITALIIISFTYFLMKIQNFSKQSMTNILLLNVALIISFCCVELILRKSGINATWAETSKHAYLSSYRYWESTLYHEWPSNSVINIHLPEYDLTRKTNSLGLCDTEHPVIKDSNEFRIIGIGDSFTEGSGAHTDSTWLKFLERSIKTNRPAKLRFMNAGLSGSDPFFEYVLLRDKLLKYKPNLVILAINFTDINDILVKGGMERFKPDGTLDHRRGPSWEWVYALSYTFRLIIHNVFQYNNDLMSPEVYKKEFLRSKDQLKQSLLLFDSLAKNNHFRLLIVLHPSLAEVNDKKYINLSDICNFATDNHIPCFDMLDYFLKKERITVKNSRDYYWVHDPHHNSRGYAAFARGLEWKLKQMGMIDSINCLKHE